MLDCNNRDSDGDLSFKTTNSSSESSMSSARKSCSSYSFLSFELCTGKPHRSSDVAYSLIRSATFRRKVGLTFRDFHLVRPIGSGDIDAVDLCWLTGQEDNNDNDEESYEEECNNRMCYNAMKVVGKEALALKKKVEELKQRGRA